MLFSVWIDSTAFIDLEVTVITQQSEGLISTSDRVTDLLLWSPAHIPFSNSSHSLNERHMNGSPAARFTWLRVQKAEQYWGVAKYWCFITAWRWWISLTSSYRFPLRPLRKTFRNVSRWKVLLSWERLKPPGVLLRWWGTQASFRRTDPWASPRACALLNKECRRMTFPAGVRMSPSSICSIVDSFINENISHTLDEDSHLCVSVFQPANTSFLRSCECVCERRGNKADGVQHRAEDLSIYKCV